MGQIVNHLCEHLTEGFCKSLYKRIRVRRKSVANAFDKFSGKHGEVAGNAYECFTQCAKNARETFYNRRRGFRQPLNKSGNEIDRALNKSGNIFENFRYCLRKDIAEGCRQPLKSAIFYRRIKLVDKFCAVLNKVSQRSVYALIKRDAESLCGGFQNCYIALQVVEFCVRHRLRRSRAINQIRLKIFNGICRVCRNGVECFQACGCKYHPAV